MSDLKLFQLTPSGPIELPSTSVEVEKSLQTLIERHLSTFLGVTFLASEYSTGKVHRGRIDTLGIDENGCPVIIEYKRSLNENVISQGLYYLDWLMDHRGEFELLVWKRLGQGASERIDWSSPRLLCVAGGFTKYDVHAVQQINRNIELLRYRKYGNDFLLLEWANPVEAREPEQSLGSKDAASTNGERNVREALAASAPIVRELFASLEAYVMNLGDDVQLKALKHYFAFRRLKNFLCVAPQSKALVLWAKVDPTTVRLEEGFTRDVREIGHHGTGDLEIYVKSMEDLERAKRLILRSYESS